MRRFQHEAVIQQINIMKKMILVWMNRILLIGDVAEAIIRNLPFAVNTHYKIELTDLEKEDSTNLFCINGETRLSERLFANDITTKSRAT